jgi:hypothetical protein
MITLNCPRSRVAFSASSYPSMPGIVNAVIRISIRWSPEVFLKHQLITSHPSSSSIEAVISRTSSSSSTNKDYADNGNSQDSTWRLWGSWLFRRSCFLTDPLSVVIGASCLAGWPEEREE